MFDFLFVSLSLSLRPRNIYRLIFFELDQSESSICSGSDLVSRGEERGLALLLGSSLDWFLESLLKCFSNLI